MAWLDSRPLRAAAPTIASCAVHAAIAVPLALCITAPRLDGPPVELEIVAPQMAAASAAPTPPAPSPPPPLPAPVPGARAIRPPTSGTMAIAAPKRRGASDSDPDASAPMVVGEEAEDQPPSLSTIRISRAWYGWNSPDCEPADRTSFVAAACDGQSHCVFRISNGTLGGDPCPDVPKGLQVLWECLDAFGAPHDQPTKGADPAPDDEPRRIAFHCY